MPTENNRLLNGPWTGLCVALQQSPFSLNAVCFPSLIALTFGDPWLINTSLKQHQQLHSAPSVQVMAGWGG